MTTTTQTPVVTPFNHFGNSAGAVYSYVNTPQQSTTPPQSSAASASSSQHQSPIQQDSSDCGSSSGVGGSGMTNKHESDASSLDSDSRDSGAGLPQPQQQQLLQQQHNNNNMNGIVVPTIAQNNGILAHHHGYPSHIIQPHHIQHQQHLHQVQHQQQQRYPQHQHPSTTTTTTSAAGGVVQQQHPRHWAPTTTIPPPSLLPPPGVSNLPPPPPPPPLSIRPLYTMTVSPGNGYDSRQPPPSQSSTIITAGPTMTQSNSMGTIPGGISSPSINGSSNSGTTTNNPATSGIPTQTQIPSTNGTHDVFVHIQAGEVISLLAGSDVQQIKGPATIRMIGQSNISPNALPLRVPLGHLVQQILDEHVRYF
uniref:Uncharacterized protein n=1 Tax=Panagrolaimus sp. ES5 TaxID=591445 RepID=A0AC34F956_9BILA